MSSLLVFGLGYTGLAIAALASSQGWQVIGTSRNPAPGAPDGIRTIRFDEASPAVSAATHIISTVPPVETGDPVLARFGAAIRAAVAAPRRLEWLGYLSTTGVYGDRGGGWVDEDSEPAPAAARSIRRLAAEAEWRETAGSAPLDLFRVAGIYGPGRSALDDVRSGRARRITRPGHEFGRIHRDDIAAAVIAAATRKPQGTRVLNLSDDLPAASADVVEAAARMLGLPVPPPVPYETAEPTMGEMARSFWAENRKVASRKTQAALGIAWRYPDYRAGLEAILRQEADLQQRADDKA